MNLENSQQPPAQQYLNQQAIANIPPPRNKFRLLLLVILLFVVSGIAYYLVAKQNNQIAKIGQRTINSQLAVNPSVTQISPTTRISLPTDIPQELKLSQIDSLREIQGSTLAFVDIKNGGVMLLNGLGSKPILIDKNGESPVYSAILSKVAYTEIDAQHTGEYVCNIYAYDIKTTKTEIIKTNYKPFGNCFIQSWSPNGKYLLTNAGTYVVRTMTIFEYPSGRTIATLVREDDYLAWDQNGNLISSDQTTNVTPTRTWGNGKGSSIMKISMSGEQEQIIRGADSQYDYGLIEVNNNTIYYVRTDVQKEISCPNSHCEKDDSKTYWQMSSDSKDARPIEYNDIPNLHKRKTVSSNLSNKLLGYYVGYCDINENFQNWVACSLYNSSNHDHKIGIFNLNKPNLGVITIIDGNNPSW